MRETSFQEFDSIKKIRYLFHTLILGGIIVGIFFFGRFVFADPAHNVNGLAWSDTIGWISMHGTGDDPIIDTGGVDSGGSGFLGFENVFAQSTIEYGVNISNTNGAATQTGTGTFSGYAWSSNLGWISFQEFQEGQLCSDSQISEGSGDVIVIPIGGVSCRPVVDWSTGEVSGWAKILGKTGSPLVDLGFSGPFSETYIKASTPVTQGYFGGAVDIFGSTAVVGTLMSVPGQQDERVHVFEEDSNEEWQYVQQLQGQNTELDDSFGKKIAVDGERIIIGAKGEDSSSETNPLANTRLESGAVYIFEKSTGSWVQTDFIKASNRQAGDIFGLSVAISGDYAIVGAIGEDGDGINGPLNNSASAAGAAYVFKRDTTGNWQEEAYLKASNAGAGDNFGYAVAIDGTRIIVGAWEEESNGSSPLDNSLNAAGAAYIFERQSDGTWQEVAYLKEPNPESANTFGSSLSLSGDRVLIGAPSANDNVGAAYIFERQSDGTWTPVIDLLSLVSDTLIGFAGGTVSISGNIAIVDQGSTSDGNGVSVFKREQVGGWMLVNHIQSSNLDPDDNFGDAIAMDESRIIAGAWTEDGNGSDPSDNSLNAAGAVYIFEPEPQPSSSDWSGWISLQGLDYGVTIDTTTGDFHGYAWGGDPVGWISFNCADTPGGCGSSPYKVNVDLPPIIPPGCGNGTLDAGEACDGTLFLSGNGSCVLYNPAYDSGQLNCNSDCTVNTSSCGTCGNNIRDGIEVCDGSDLGGVTSCTQLSGGYIGGVPSCNTQCDGFNTLACTEPVPVEVCGDGEDNDGDLLSDDNDPGCWVNPLDGNTYDAELTNEDNCGNGYCEARTGENPLSCRADCSQKIRE